MEKMQPASASEGGREHRIGPDPMRRKVYFCVDLVHIRQHHDVCMRLMRARLIGPDLRPSGYRGAYMSIDGQLIASPNRRPANLIASAIVAGAVAFIASA